MAIDRTRNALTATVDVNGRVVNRWKSTGVIAPAQRMDAVPVLRSMGTSTKVTNRQMNERIAALTGKDFTGVQLDVAESCTRAYYEGYTGEFSYKDDLDYPGIASWIIDKPLPEHEAIREPDEDDGVFGTYDYEELEEEYGSEKWVGQIDNCRALRRAAITLSEVQVGIADPHVFTQQPGHSYDMDTLFIEDAALAFSLLQALREAEEFDGELYRQTHMRDADADEVLAQLQAQQTVDLPLISTADAHDLAMAFGQDEHSHVEDGSNDVVVRYTIEPGAQALEGRKMSRSEVFSSHQTDHDPLKRDQEWVTGGRFEVLSAESGGPGLIDVRMRQVQTFSPMGGN